MTIAWLGFFLEFSLKIQKGVLYLVSIVTNIATVTIGGTLPAIMKQLKIHFSFIFLLFLSCSQKKETLQQKLESEFEQSKLKIAGKEFNIRTFPDWEAKAYFKNNKAVLIFQKTKPEIGFTTKRIYCDEFGNVIEKVVYRKCLPNWKEGSRKLHDSTYIIFPKNNLVESYFENKLINSSKKVKFSEEIIRQAKYTKKQVEEITAGNSRL